MEKTVLEQEREIKDVIRRAKGSPDKTGSLRRDTFTRLIDLIHSPHPALKIHAAQSIRFFFNDFPDLEDAAINAVYDLCEDQSPKVRIEGYNAITYISKAETRWVKRNADVLLQLLQSDEPDEVIVVKKALTEHLDMDPKVTLGVLCDQIAPPDDPMDEEEQHIRDRLRFLVLSFLTGEAKRAIVERHSRLGSQGEEVLINSLLAAITKLGLSDVELIIKSLLLSLQAYQSRSAYGAKLLQILLDKVAPCLRTGIRSGNPTSLHDARLYLDLVKLLVIERKAAPPIQLLRFYCSQLSSRVTLQAFPVDERTLLVCNMAETLVACKNDPSPDDGGPRLEDLQRQVVDACPFLLESLGKSGLPLGRPTDASIILLRACVQRKEQTNWTPPPNLMAALNNIQLTETKDHHEAIQVFIRSLDPSRNAPALQKGANLPVGVLESGLPKKPVGRLPSQIGQLRTDSPPRRIMAPSKTKGQTSIKLQSTTATDKHMGPQDDSPRPQKRRKETRDEDSSSRLSLLSRLGSPHSEVYSSNPEARSSQVVQQSIERQQPPGGEWSIKGAASLIAAETSSVARTPVDPSTSSLLDRLEDGSGSRKKKKRGWLHGRD